MYKCENCSKIYKSQKRYFAHIDKCQDAPVSLKSGKSIASISDVEHDNYSVYSISSNMSKVLDEKDKYKSAAKKYKKKLDKYMSDYETDIEKNNEYYKNQLSTINKKVVSITKENDEIKDKLLSQYNKKLLLEKKRLESKYESEKYSAITELKKNIDTLNETINEKVKEIDDVKQEETTKISILKTNYENEIKKMANKLHRQVSDYENQKKSALAFLTTEKDKEINILSMEKNTEINNLKFTIDKLQKDMKNIQDEYNTKIRNLNCEHTLECGRIQNKMNNMSDNHKNMVESLKNDHNSILNHTVETKQKELDKIKEEYQNTINIEKLKQEDEYRKLEIKTKNEIQKVQNEITKYENEATKAKSDAEILIKKGEENNKRLIDNMEKDQKYIVKSLSQNADKKLKEAIYERDNTINELERLNHLLGNQIGQYTSSLDNMKMDSDNVKKKFISNLNNQKEEYDKLLEEKLKTIVNLEAKIKHDSNKHSIAIKQANNDIHMLKSQRDSLQNKIDDLQRFYNDLKTKTELSDITRSKMADNYEKTIQKLKNDNTISTVEKIRELETAYKNKIASLENTLKITTTHLEKSKSSISKEISVQRRELLSNEEKTKKLMIDEIEVLKSDKAELIKKISNLILEKNNNYTKLLNEYNQTKDGLQKNISILQEELRCTKNALKDNKENFQEQMKKIVGLSDPEKEDFRQMKLKVQRLEEEKEKLISEKIALTNDIKLFKKKIEDMETNFLEEKGKMDKEREAWNKKSRAFYKDSTTEDKLRKMRDDCVETIRKQKAEMKKIKDENHEITRELKETGILKGEHDKILVETKERVKELEKILSDTLSSRIPTSENEN